MKMCIEIEVDDRAPNEEFCGKGCKGLNKGNCQIFDMRLEDDSNSKFDDIINGTVETQEIRGWIRCKQCINNSYAFGNAKII
jgi:hypothetical protein